MIKSFEAFEPHPPLKKGDRVVIKYKDSKCFMKTGTIIYIRKNVLGLGDCTVQLDFSDEYVVFYYTNLEKIIDLISVPSGEMVCISLKDAENLAMSNIIRYNKFMQYYYFDDDERWQIEEYII
jgi:hypothetical protein